LVQRLRELQGLVVSGQFTDVTRANALLRQVFDAVVVDDDQEGLTLRWKIPGPDASLFLPEKDGYVYHGEDEAAA
jgi:hypothetical protein